jgi:hypothetical protein
MERFWSKVDKSGDCWIWMACRVATGYGRFHFAKRATKAHRVAWELTNGAIPDGICVLHRCDVPACVNPAHLFLGTHAENWKDMREKGRASGGRLTGSANRNSKLTETTVRAIRAYCQRGFSYACASRKFGVSDVQVSNIIRRLQWRHI